MGTIAEKLQYTKNSIDDIQSALVEIGVEITDEDPLGEYAKKIREKGSGWKVYDSGEFAVTDDAVLHSAYKEDSGYVENSTWVQLCGENVPFYFCHYHNIGFDVSKLSEENVKIMGQIITDNEYAFRNPAGYSSGTTTIRYQYFELIPFGQYNECGIEYKPKVGIDSSIEMYPYSFAFTSKGYSNSYAPTNKNYKPLTTKVELTGDSVQLNISGRNEFYTRGSLDQVKVRYWIFYK